MERNGVYRIRVDEVDEVQNFLRHEGFAFDPVRGEVRSRRIYEEISGKRWLQRLSDFMADKRDTAQGYFLDLLTDVYVIPYQDSRLEQACEKYIIQHPETDSDSSYIQENQKAV